MIVESIVYLIGQDLLVSHNRDEFVYLRAIIYDVVIIFCFWQRKYVRDAPVVKPDGFKPREGCLCPDNPCSCIKMDMDKQPKFVVDVVH